MPSLRSLHLLALSILLTSFSTSCSVFMAAKQPKKKNLQVLTPGTPRALVIAELGAPVHSESKSGLKTDVFSFTQGYSKGAKTGRAFAHGLADLVTLGAWEVIGTPTEAIFDGRDMAVQVDYTATDVVNKSVMLKK